MADETRGLPIREEVWLRAWIAVATADNCIRVSTPKEWADECLKEFDERFPASAA